MCNTQRIRALSPHLLLITWQAHVPLQHKQHTRRQCIFATLVVDYMAGTCSAVSWSTHKASVHFHHTCCRLHGHGRKRRRPLRVVYGAHHHAGQLGETGPMLPFCYAVQSELVSALMASRMTKWQEHVALEQHVQHTRC
jgi:hypothetical protein